MLIGPEGRVGTELRQLIEKQEANLRDKLGIDVRVSAALGSKGLLATCDGPGTGGLDLANTLAGATEFPDGDAALAALSRHIEADINPHRVVIDCTASPAVAALYPQWLGSGVSVIGPSKVLASSDFASYQQALDAAEAGGSSWEIESAIGSALPVVGTLRDLLYTGDHIRKVFFGGR